MTVKRRNLKTRHYSVKRESSPLNILIEFSNLDIDGLNADFIKVIPGVATERNFLSARLGIVLRLILAKELNRRGWKKRLLALQDEIKSDLLSVLKPEPIRPGQFVPWAINIY